MIRALTQLASHKAPAGRPQPMAFHEGTLWLGCWDSSTLYAIDPRTWTIEDEVPVPAKPYGIASFQGALRVVIGLGEADDRYIYHFEPGKAFGEEGRIACPDFTGSHLTTDGTALYLAQQTHRRMLELDETGATKRTIPFSTRSAGIGFDGATFYTIAADDDFDVLEFATLDLDAPDARPVVISPMNAEARGLAFDGTNWWTAHREDGDVVSFRV